MSQPLPDEKMDDKKIRGDEETASLDDTVSVGKGDILSLENTDPVLNAKMHLINNVSDARLCLSYELSPRTLINISFVRLVLIKHLGRLLMKLASRRGRSNCSSSMDLGRYPLFQPDFDGLGIPQAHAVCNGATRRSRSPDLTHACRFPRS